MPDFRLDHPTGMAGNMFRAAMTYSSFNFDAFRTEEQLDIEDVSCWHSNLCKGSACCSHGIMPLPATAATFRGKSVYPTDLSKEIITPTGAIFLGQDRTSFRQRPSSRGRTVRSGWETLRLEHVNGLRAAPVSKHGAPPVR
jgi:uncharacterized protein (DUF111 family)